MEETYYAKYKTGRTGLIAAGSITFALILWILIMLIARIEGIAFFTVLLIFFGGCFFVLLRSYREILLYPKRMVVTSLIDGVIAEIDYTDITHIGFLNGTTQYRGRFLSGGSSVSTGDLIILLNGGGRQKFSDDDYDNLHEVYAFIQEKIGNVEQVF